jgi:hypothetical protein
MADVLHKLYTNFVGLDLKSNDLVRNDNFASALLNCQNDKDGNLEKRKGYQARGESKGGFGMFVYNRVDPTTGKQNEELVTADESLHRVVETTFTITYSGTESIVFLSMLFDPATDQYRMKITEGSVQVLDTGLGRGFDEGTIQTLAGLKSIVDGITDFAASISGDNSLPAAFLKSEENFDFSAGDYIGVVKEYEQVNETFGGSTHPFSGSETNKLDDEFENISGVQLSNVLYLSNGYDDLMKYDGQTIYRAGLPTPIAPLLNPVAGSALDNTADPPDPDVWQYQVRYTQYDAAGNIIDSQPTNFEELSLTHASQPRDVEVTVGNIVAGSGFNTNCAIVDGPQVAVNTITVDNGGGGGHTLKVGDTAYFFDSVSSSYVQRSVTSVGTNSITIAGAAVTVADDDVISNNLRIGIFRSEANGTFTFLSAEIPNNSFTATQLYLDQVTDENLGFQLIEPEFIRGLPPKGRYLTTFNSQLVVLGNIENPNLWFWSNVFSPEYFPTNNVDRSDTNGDEKIVGGGQSNEVFAVFKRCSIDIISGDISTNNIRRDVLTNDLGCESHHTIQEVRGKLYFLSDRGVYSISGGQLPIQESTVLEPVFEQEDTLTQNRFNMRRAVAINHRVDEQYILFLPIEQISGSDRGARQDSVIFMKDYYRGSWYQWSNINMAGGAVLFNQELHFQERRVSGFSGTVDHLLYKQLPGENRYDFQDNTEPIDWQYRTAWYHLGEPSVFKHWLILKMFALPKNNANQFVLDVAGELNFLNDFQGFDFQIDFSTLGSGYGISPYGTSPYGNPTDFSFRHKINSKSRSMRLFFRNQEHQTKVNLTGWEIDVAGSFRKEIKE